MAALCAATAIIAVVVPFAAGVSLLGTVPMGLLVYRYRLRVLIAATVAGATIAFLIAGMGGFMTVVNCAYIGLLIGIIKRRGRGTPTVLVVGLVAGAVFGAAVRGSAVDSGPAAPPDLRVDDRQRRRRGRGPRAHPQLVVAARHGRLRRASEERLRHRAALLAVPDRRVVGAQHHHRHADRLVGAVAGDRPAAS